MASKKKESISEEKYNFISGETKKWKKNKIITAVQEKKILNLYTLSSDQKPTIASYIAIFGAILIGLGIILFYAINWATIPKTVKVISILGFLIAAYHIGYVMKFKKANYPKVGSALIFLGTILFGAGIFLIAQIYHINSHWPNAFLFWGIGTALIVYRTNILATAYLMILTAIAYIFSESLFWFMLIDGSNDITYAFMLIFLSAGIGLYALGQLHQKKEMLSKLKYPFHLFGSALILLVLFFFSFKDFVVEQEPSTISQISILFHSKFWIIYLILSAIALVAIVLCYQKRETKTEQKEILIGSALLTITPVLVLFANDNRVLMPLFFNILLFAAIIGMIQLGIAKKDKTLVNLGMVAFGISVFARYIEYLWNVINGYFFFLIAGALLIALAIILEKNRRKLLDKVAAK